MTITKTKIEGVYIIDLVLREDARGYFTRVFGKDELEKYNISYSIAQINRSLTITKGTIRGLHYQKKPKEEDKIVQCLDGRIFDVAVDLRKDSKTFGEWVGVELSKDNKRMLLIPKGCAHGFQSLEKNCLVEYFVSQFYSPDNERGLLWNDPTFNVDWPIKKASLSEKDQSWPLFK